MKKLLLLLMLIPLLVFSQGKKISEYPKIATPNDSDIVLVNKWTGVNTFSTKTMYYIDLKNAINSGDTSYLTTTGVAYQHDSLYIKKLLSGGDMQLISATGLTLNESVNNRNILDINTDGTFRFKTGSNNYDRTTIYKNDSVFYVGSFNDFPTKYGTFLYVTNNGEQYNANINDDFITYYLQKNGDFIYSAEKYDTLFAVTGGKMYLPKAQDKDNNLDSVLVYNPSTGQFKIRDASSLGAVDTTALKTTGKTYQHDSLYVDKLFVQSTGAINSNVYTIPTTSTTNGVNWSGNNVSIKSPVAGTLTHYVGSTPTFAVAAGQVTVAGNLYCDNSTRSLGASATPFGTFYVNHPYIKTLPTLDNTNDVVLVRNATTGKIDYRSASSITSPPQALTSTRIAFGSGTNLVTGSADLTWNNTTKRLDVNGSGYFGATTGIAKLNVHSTEAGEIISAVDQLGNKRLTAYTDGVLVSKTSATESNTLTGAGLYMQTVEGGGVHIGVGGVEQLLLQTVYGDQRITFKSSLNIHSTTAGLATFSDSFVYFLRKVNINVDGNAMLNLKAANDNGTSKMISGYNSSYAEKFTVLDNGNTFLNGNNGIAKLNITTSGTGGASEGLSIHDNGGNKKAFILDNGKIITSKSIQVSDDTDAATDTNVGSIRYRTSGNNSYTEMVMQTGASTYAWVIIKENNW